MSGGFSLLVGATLAVALPCVAQTNMDITPFVGLDPQTTVFPAPVVPCLENVPGEPANCPAVVSKKAALTVGARLTTWVGKRMALELSIGQTADLATGSLSAVYSLASRDSASAFFVLGGLSFVATEGSTYSNGSSVAPSQTDWGPVLGLGARVPLSPTLAIRLQAEDYLYRLTDVGGVASNSTGQHALVFSVGPSVTLGGRPAPASDSRGVTDHR